MISKATSTSIQSSYFQVSFGNDRSKLRLRCNQEEFSVDFDYSKTVEKWTHIAAGVKNKRASIFIDGEEIGFRNFNQLYVSNKEVDMG